MIKQENLPKLKIKDRALSENTYRIGNKYWRVTTLIQYAKEKEYKIFDLPLIGIDISITPFDVNNFSDFLYHSNLVNKADTNYPIILDDNGYIADGWHRVAKSILNGENTIKAIRLEEMPTADGEYTSEQ